MLPEYSALQERVDALFQSSPGPKAGCYAMRLTTYCDTSRFQSSPGPKAGCYIATSTGRRSAPMFQSSPGPKAGCYRHRLGQRRRQQAVSILTRPESRVLRSMSGLPAPRPYRFNPHPARKPGATGASPPPRCLLTVSILTRPESRVLPPAARAVVGSPWVSILTRPESRVLRHRRVLQRLGEAVSILTRPESRVLPRRRG